MGNGCPRILTNPNQDNIQGLSLIYLPDTGIVTGRDFVNEI